MNLWTKTLTGSRFGPTDGSKTPQEAVNTTLTDSLCSKHLKTTWTALKLQNKWIGRPWVAICWSNCWFRNKEWRFNLRQCVNLRWINLLFYKMQDYWSNVTSSNSTFSAELITNLFNWRMNQSVKNQSGSTYWWGWRRQSSGTGPVNGCRGRRSSCSCVVPAACEPWRGLRTDPAPPCRAETESFKPPSADDHNSLLYNYSLL